jgi:hypothetical protein
MAATLYTGTGAALAVSNAVNGISFQPDLVWMKSRSNATDNELVDSVRGATKSLISNSGAAEATDANGLTAFGSTGFTLGTDANYNGSGRTFVGWQWKANGAAVTNTAGSITSQVSANTTAGFSVATFSGAIAGTVGHGLGVAPKMIIIKSTTTATGWYVYTETVGASGWFQLNTAAAAVTGNPAAFGGTAPTSTVWSYGSGLAGTGNYVAYCWAAVPGYSAFGSYTGNGSTDGPFVYLGFRPRFVLYKATQTADAWQMYDTSRNTSNATDLALAPYLSAAEFDTTSLSREMDILSNGFKVRGSDAQINTNGNSYIYMAFAENPFKYANAR